MTASGEEPVSVAEMRDHLTLEIDADDAYLEQLIAAARGHAESLTNRKIMDTVVQMVVPDFPIKQIELPFGATISVTSIAYVDTAGATQTLLGSASPAVFQSDLTDDEGAVLWPLKGTDWPGVDTDDISPVTVTWVAGYGTDSEDVPAALRHAIKLQVAEWYEARWNAEAPAGSTPLFEMALSPFKVIRYGA